MVDTMISGANVTASYGYEAADQYNEAPSSHAESTGTYVAFGRAVEVSVSRTNNKERAYSVGQRNAEETVTKQFGGSLSVNGTLSNAYWLLGLLGSVVDGGTTGAYTHTYSEEDVQPTITIKRTMDFGDTQGTETMIGGIINTGSISAAVNDSVKFSLEIPYRYEADPDEATTISEVVDTHGVFVFSGATIESPTSTELAGIESFELSINNTVDLEYGLGSRYAEAVTSKNREYNINYTMKIKDYTELKKFIATSEVATLTMRFENQSGDTLVLTFAEFHLNEDNLPTSPTEIVKEECSGWAHSCTSAVYTNSTETSPQQPA
jgi:hypothetical protein